MTCNDCAGNEHCNIKKMINPMQPTETFSQSVRAEIECRHFLKDQSRKIFR